MVLPEGWVKCLEEAYGCGGKEEEGEEPKTDCLSAGCGEIAHLLWLQRSCLQWRKLNLSCPLLELSGLRGGLCTTPLGNS